MGAVGRLRHPLAYTAQLRELREEITKLKSEGKRQAVRIQERTQNWMRIVRWRWRAKQTVVKSWRCVEKEITKVWREIEDFKKMDEEEFNKNQKEEWQQELHKLNKNGITCCLAGLEIGCCFAEFVDHRCSLDVSSILVVMVCRF